MKVKIVPDRTLPTFRPSVALHVDLQAPQMKYRPRSAVAGLLLLVTAPVHAALIGILPATPGGSDYQAYYDDILDVTYLADANYAGSNNLGVLTIPTTGVNAGIETYSEMTKWLVALNSVNDGAGHLGVNGWRFPYTPTDDPGCSAQITSPYVASYGSGCTAGELGHLYYTYGITTTNEGPFVNVERETLATSGYWSSEISSALFVSYYFRFNSGELFPSIQTTGAGIYTWPVHDGDISVIPLPAAGWLLGSALLGLAGIARRR